MKSFFAGKRIQPFLVGAVILLLMGLMAAGLLLIPVPSFTSYSNGRTLPFALTRDDLDEYCNDLDNSDFSSQMIDPSNAQCDDTTPITNDENTDNLTFTGACQDIARDWLADVSHIKARINPANNSVQCYSSSNGGTSFTPHSNGRTLPFALTADDLEEYCNDLDDSDFSSQMIDPSNAQCDDTTPITNDEDTYNLTFAEACQDVAQDWLADVSHIKARINSADNSVQCYSSSGGSRKPK